jgi:hypothetical protein
LAVRRFNTAGDIFYWALFRRHHLVLRGAPFETLLLVKAARETAGGHAGFKLCLTSREALLVSLCVRIRGHHKPYHRKGGPGGKEILAHDCSPCPAFEQDGSMAAQSGICFDLAQIA